MAMRCHVYNLNIIKGLYRIADSGVVEGQVEIDTRSSIIHLSHPAGMGETFYL